MTKSFVRRVSTALSPLVLLIATAAPVFARDTAEPTTATTATNPQTEAGKAWNFAASDVPVDPNIVFGVLPNGMKYALLANSTPKDSVVLRMRFDVGSFAEAEGGLHISSCGVRALSICMHRRPCIKANRGLDAARPWRFLTGT